MIRYTPYLVKNRAVNEIVGVLEILMEAYVKGNVHTNGIENFWSLLKRTIRGTYVSVEPFHLFRYVDEQSFRFNNRGNDNRDRFLEVLSAITDKRITYKHLTGKDSAVVTTTPTQG